MTSPDLGHSPTPLANLPASQQAFTAGHSDNITTQSDNAARLRLAMSNPDSVLSKDPITVGSSVDSFSKLRGVHNPYGTGIRAYEPNTVLLQDYSKAYDAVQQSKADDAAAQQLKDASKIVVPGTVGYQTGGVYNGDGKVNSMVQAALALASKRTPYVWGGTTSNGVDCSGLIYYAAQAAGIKGVKRYRAQDYGKMGSAVSMKDARPGDIVFYDESASQGPGAGHVGIYLGNGMMVAAPQTGDVVKVQKVYGTPTSIRRVFDDNSFNSVATPDGSYTFNYQNAYYNPGAAQQASGTINRSIRNGTRPI